MPDVLLETGAKLVDPNGELQAGCPLCAPEADAATGMVAKIVLHQELVIFQQVQVSSR